MKFGRSYRLRIVEESRDSEGNIVQGEEVVITNPITIKFTVQRHTGSTLNTFQAEIYNLSENVRNFLFQEPWTDRIKKVTFEAGYDTLSTLYIGEIWTGFSYREGPDIITSIECRSSVWALDTTTVYETINTGGGEITVKDCLSFLCGKFKDELPVGAIGDFPEKYLRPVVLNGNVWDLIKKISDNSAFIDNGKIYVLRRNEVLDGEIVEINESSGLLASPRRHDLNIQLQMLFEPRFIMDQVVRLNIGGETVRTGKYTQEVTRSPVGNVYNGNWKVFGIQHMGIISESQGGDLRTVIDLNTEGTAFKTVREVVQD